MQKYYSKTFSGFSRPSFLSGIARIFDFAGTLRAAPVSSRRTDTRALQSDWQAVGDDLKTAINDYERNR